MPNLARAVNKILSPFDLKLSRASVVTRWQMPSGLRRLADVCPQVKTVIDIGAASGTWCAIAHQVFPNAALLAVEPLPDSFMKLQEQLRTIPVSYGVQTVVSDVDGAHVEFTISPDRDGSGVGLSGGITKQMVSRTLDSLINEMSASGPFLIKLDTHGHELRILTGAAQTLSQATAVVIEAYNYKLTEDSPLFWQLVDVMVGYGFRPFDVVDPSPRPLDGSLWQLDIIFLPINHPAFANNAYL